ncbi:MAG TPA: energy transducer TonB [Burkholderiales bacterium]|nr:energy transducer TonB [Burkholderiales bacterium]
MSAAADALPFRRHEPALGPSMGLSVVMHVVLIAVLFFGVRIQSTPPAQVMVELWDPPPPPPPAPVVEVKPPPPPPVVKPEPEPEVKKPEIVLPEKPKPKPKPEAKKPEPKPEPKPKPAPPKRDLAFEKQLREQAMAEQKALDDQRRRLDEQRKERELKDLIARQQVDARNKALATWTDRIRARIRGNIILPQDVPGNPEAIFDVALLPSGDVLSVRKRKSSGNAAYDDAVERAILRSSPLPLPDDRTLFQRQLELRFRPQDR